MEILKFWAEWCGPCHAITSSVIEISGATGITVTPINIDEEKDKVIEYKVASIPTLILLKDGKEIARHTGSAPKRKIASSLGLEI